MPRERQNAMAVTGLALLLAAATVLQYLPVAGFDFINYDDPKYVTANLRVAEGLTRDGVVWAFETRTLSNWHPLTWLSHMTDVELFGLDAGRHHLTSLALHAANALLLFLVLLRMTGARGRSFFAAALFALHPLHVESVAWIAERKDVLSTFFGFLAVGAYARYAERPGWPRYLPVFLFLALGLMAKPMLVTLPAALLLLDLWPLGRLAPAEGTMKASAFARTLAHLTLEKVPLFLLAFLSAAVTYAAQSGGGAVGAVSDLSVWARLSNALVSTVRYLLKTLWPAKLSIFYPHPGGATPLWQPLLAGTALLAATALALRLIRRSPWLTVGWLWYLGTLVPVIGIVQVGSQAMADRYTYLPLVGIFVAAAWGGAAAAGRFSPGTRTTAALAALLLAAVFTAGRMQVGHWKDSLTVFGHALDADPDNWLAHNMLGNALLEAQRPGEAAEHFARALEGRPNLAEARMNLGRAASMGGRPGEALSHYRRALAMDGGNHVTRYNLGNALYALGKLEEAAEQYRQALEIEPAYAEARVNLGNVLSDLGRYGEAEGEYREAIRLNRRSPLAWINLSATLFGLGRTGEAVTLLEECLRYNPGSAEAHFNLGRIAELTGRRADAIEGYRRALAIRPDYREARRHLEELGRRGP